MAKKTTYTASSLPVIPEEEVVAFAEKHLQELTDTIVVEQNGAYLLAEDITDGWNMTNLVMYDLELAQPYYDSGEQQVEQEEAIQAARYQVEGIVAGVIREHVRDLDQIVSETTKRFRHDRQAGHRSVSEQSQLDEIDRIAERAAQQSDLISAKAAAIIVSVVAELVFMGYDTFTYKQAAAALEKAEMERLGKTRPLYGILERAAVRQ